MSCALRGATWLLLLALAARGQDALASAQAAWRAGEREQALELVAAALAEAPGDRTLRRTLGEWQLATHRHVAALETVGNDADLASIRGRALYLLGRHVEALACLSSDDPFDVLLRVDALEVLGDDEATSAALRLAEQSDLGAAARLAEVRGRLLSRQGQHADAAASFRAALAEDPLSAGAHFGLGRALLALGQRDEAMAVLERHRALVPLLDRRDAALRALDLAPRHGPGHAQLGDVERELGRSAEARAAYEHAGQLAEVDELAPIVLRHARLLAEDLADLEGAVALLDAAAARSQDARLPVRAGDLLAEAGRWADAARRYEQALTLRPQDERIAERLENARREGGLK